MCALCSFARTTFADELAQCVRMDGFDSQTVDPPDRCRAAPSGAVFFSSEVHTATCAASQRSNLRPQASAAPPLTRPCPRGVTQLARLAPIARTDAIGRGNILPARHTPGTTSSSTNLTSAEECDTCPAGNFAWVACKTAAEDRPSTPWWASHCRRRAGRARRTP